MAVIESVQSVPVPPDSSAVTTFREVLAAIERLGPASEHRSFVLVAQAAPAADWTAAMAVQVLSLATGPYRDDLEAMGWDVDLLPPPSAMTSTALSVTPSATATLPQPGPGALPDTPREPGSARQATSESQPDHPQVTSAADRPEVLVDLSSDARIQIITPPGHPLRTGLRDYPGSAWDGHQAWLLPADRYTADRLREDIKRHGATFTAPALEALRAAANSNDTPNVDIADGKINLTFASTLARNEEARTRVHATWHQESRTWVAPLDRIGDAAQFAERHGLTLSNAAQDALAAHTAPFDYDGTIDGLRGVPVTELAAVRAHPERGKTPSLADRLANFGVESVYDLLMVIPIRYLDRSTVTPLHQLGDIVGSTTGLLAKIEDVGAYDRAKRMCRITVKDERGRLTATFFNAPWIPRRFRRGQEVSIWGRVDAYTNPRTRTTAYQMANPIIDVVDDVTTKYVPVYPQSEKHKVTTWDLHAAAIEAVSRLGDLQDPLPSDLRTRNTLIERIAAYRNVHHPEDLATAAEARRRLAFDELLRMQLALGLRRNAVADETGVEHKPTGALTQQLIQSLPYPLTGAQARVTTEIVTDLARPHPMHRLLQGDVGSGKSTVAQLTLLTGIESGFQGALMAPTEILASQLHLELAERFLAITHPDGRPLVVEFLANKTKAKDRRRILTALADGSVDVVVGTHALLSDDVKFANLGIVVVDEQHRFGVEQRATLRDKGTNGMPDMLVMTATPIPRTAAMTVYGDLAVSILDELPPGRTPIRTTWLSEEPPLDALTGPPWAQVRAAVEEGRQAYIVASLVEENEKIAAASASAAFESLQNGALSGLRIGLVHGQQPRDEREATMASFKRAELDVLIATTVIEVGVNVPNATVMVVLDAPRFGIAQLHQIRGRVGRGEHSSICILTGKAGSVDAVHRMEALCESTDGFHLSEVDLDLRGEGSIYGARQSGQNDLRVASLRDDRDMIQVCRGEALALLDGDPSLSRRPGLRQEVRSALGPDAEEWLARS